jgi:hypothetical protein
MRCLRRCAAVLTAVLPYGWPRHIARIGIFILAAALDLSGGLVIRELRADNHTTGVPQWSSLPGASYTLYLDFAGFNFTGTWAGTGNSPGSQPAFNNFSATGSFTVAEQDKIALAWVGAAQAYAPFNINVTTVDPAIAAGQADTDAHRQAYYDRTPGLAHTVIGRKKNNWDGTSGVGGRSSFGTAQQSYDPTGINNGAGAGLKTNWVFTEGVSSTVTGTVLASGLVAAHEDGHCLGLSHQGDYSGNTMVSDYSAGDNNGGNGTYCPIMGKAHYAQRNTWRIGDANTGQTDHIQNDVAVLLSNAGIGGFVEDNIGHSLATATPMPLSGNSVDFSRAKGVIAPASTTVPTAIGASNYTTDFFWFRTDGGPLSLTAYDGTEFLSPGTADPAATLRSTLTILDHMGLPVGTAIEAPSTLFETFSGTLPAGDYYVKIASYGGHTQTLGSYNTTYYFDMGDYFLTGSGLSALPEPGTLALLTAGLLGLLCYARRRHRPDRSSATQSLSHTSPCTKRPALISRTCAHRPLDRNFGIPIM